MASAQPAIFDERSTHHYYLEYCLRPRWDVATFKRLIAQVMAVGEEGNLVVAFGRDAWQKLAPDSMPDNFISFHPVLGAQDRIAPGTQADLLFWIHGAHHDRNFARALAIQVALREVATLELEAHGFSYLDSRDLTGFVDGTENPRATEARSVALIPEGQPGAGGSFVLSQQWVHELERFAQLGVAEQEHIIGRSKADSIELADAPETAHIRRTDVKVDGNALKIYRRSAPWGNMRENGLYFLAFSRELIRFAIQLDRMFGLAEDGVIDRLTEFSAPVSGSYFFAPSLEALSDVFGV